MRATFQSRRRTGMGNYCTDGALYNGAVSSAMCDDSGNIVGWNVNPYAPFLTAQSPDAIAIAMAQVAGAAPSAAAKEWMTANVPYFATRAREGAPSFVAWFDQYNRSNFPQGTATQPLTPAEILRAIPMAVVDDRLVPISTTTSPNSTATTSSSSTTSRNSSNNTSGDAPAISTPVIAAGIAAVVLAAIAFGSRS